MNYYEHHIGDYAAATAHLSLLEDAVYSRLLRRYYLQEAPLPADERQVARLAGARTPEEVAAVQAVLAEFFTLEADGWHNKRADEEIARYRESEPEREAKRENERERQRRHRQRRAELFETLRQNGIVPPYDTPTSRLDEMVSRVTSRVTGALHDGDATATHTPDTNIPSSLRSEGRARARATPPPCPDDVDPAVWRDWLALRKAKKAPVTETVLQLSRREAGKAGLSLTAFLEIWCARGSQGLQADWIKPAELQRARAGPNEQQAMGKQVQGLMALEAMKSGNRVAAGRTADGAPEALLLGPGAHAGR